MIYPYIFFPCSFLLYSAVSYNSSSSPFSQYTVRYFIAVWPVNNIARLYKDASIQRYGRGRERCMRGFWLPSQIVCDFSEVQKELEGRLPQCFQVNIKREKKRFSRTVKTELMICQDWRSELFKYWLGKKQRRAQMIQQFLGTCSWQVFIVEAEEVNR